MRAVVDTSVSLVSVLFSAFSVSDVLLVSPLSVSSLTLWLVFVASSAFSIVLPTSAFALVVVSISASLETLVCVESLFGSAAVDAGSIGIKPTIVESVHISG